ncbi:DUF6520 family protein [Epilithonimonas zeae]|uniref:Uncharacterized protein n=1 Tax=Epilithonimonas zeae TaxID=1416779 RepID=A0A1N6GPR7_9FLAO|nr:DUF6520 family protein [Epilithonimonas zeae]SIO09541.1 hypothetical protein SAMN05444409_1976 [Epilithonimonas zeae]
MKNLRTIILPAVLVLISAGSAFATGLSKKSNATILDGYVLRPNEEQVCQNTFIKCSTEDGPICTADVGMGSENLRELSGSSCPTTLHRIP